MKLEHINALVPSIERTQTFLTAAFPDFRIRASGHSATFGYWAHIGNEETYIALLQTGEPGSEAAEPVPGFAPEESNYRLMHIGYEVANVERLMARLAEQGYHPSITEDLDNHAFRRRVYYLDGNGIEWEFVQYLSDAPAERNDYTDTPVA